MSGKTGNTAKAKGKGPSNKGSDAKASEKPKTQVHPALFLSEHYARFKVAAAILAESLKPLGLSITQYLRAVDDYHRHKFTFSVDKTHADLVKEYSEAKVEWESFRDSFRAELDSQTIPSSTFKDVFGEDRKSPDNA